MLMLWGQSPAQPKKILVVDDHVPMRKLIAEALGQTSNYQIREARNGQEALDVLKQDSFDLVISDVMMPGMGGLELLNHIRAIQSTIPVIMVTAHPATDLTVSAMKNGAVDFLPKPFDIDELTFKVGLYLKEKAFLDETEKRKKDTVLELKAKTEELSLRSYIYDAIESGAGDTDRVFEHIVDLALKVVEGDCSLLAFFDDASKEFYPKVFSGNHDRAVVEATVKKLKDLLGEVVERKEALLIHSEKRSEIAPSLICAPLLIRGYVFGVLCVRKKQYREAFTQKDLHYILSLTKRASLNIENKMLYESIYSNLLNTFKSLVTSIQTRDSYTEEHSFRMCQRAVEVARAMQCADDQIESLQIAGWLHDVGKIAIPDSVLMKPGRLTDEEYAIIKTHPDLGVQIIRHVILFEREVTLIQHHHERWDGRGYPHGISGEQIPLESRILAVTDTFDAMTNNRPYRKALSVETAVEELKKNKWTQFDGNVVDAFLTTL